MECGLSLIRPSHPSIRILSGFSCANKRGGAFWAPFFTALVLKYSTGCVSTRLTSCHDWSPSNASLPFMSECLFVVFGYRPPTSSRVALLPPLLFPLTDGLICPFSTNCHLIQLSFSLVMGIADLPCSGYVQGEGEPHYRCILVLLLNTLSPGRQHAAAKQCDQTRGPNGNVGTTSAIQSGTKNTNGQRRPAPTTSTVPRPRSGWCGFADFTGSLPGPLGRVLGR